MSDIPDWMKIKNRTPVDTRYSDIKQRLFEYYKPPGTLQHSSLKRAWTNRACLAVLYYLDEECSWNDVDGGEITIEPFRYLFEYILDNGYSCPYLIEHSTSEEAIRTSLMNITDPLNQRGGSLPFEYDLLYVLLDYAEGKALKAGWRCLQARDSYVTGISPSDYWVKKSPSGSWWSCRWQKLLDEVSAHVSHTSSNIIPINFTDRS